MSEVVCLCFVTVIRCEKISYPRELLYFLPYEILLWPFTNLQEMVYYQYLMKALTLLPVENLHLHLATSGHAVISCVFHFLTIFTSTRRLFLQISVRYASLYRLLNTLVACKALEDFIWCADA